MTNLVLLLCIEIALFFLSFLLTGRDIMAPSVVMCIMFTISTGFALLNAQKWDVDYSLEATAIIGSGILMFITAETFFRVFFCGQLQGRTFFVKQDKSHDGVSPYQISSHRLNILIAISAALCFWQFLEVLHSTGLSLRGWSTLAFSAYRRQGVSMLAEGENSMTNGVMNQLFKIVGASGYTASYLLVNQIVYKKKSWAERIKLIILIILAFLPSIMSAGRTGIMRLLSALIIECYIVWHQKNGWNRNLSWKYLRYGIIGFAVAIPLFYYSLNFFGRTTVAGVSALSYSSSYLGGSIQLFDLYIKAPVKRKIMGEESLYSIIKVLNFLGLSKASTSYNLEFRTSGELHSNVYTFFRRPLHDFGLGGMYIFIILIAFFISWIYFKKIKYKKVKKCEFFVLLYGYLYYWIIVSSIQQYSLAYLSSGTVIYIVLIWVIFKWLALRRDDCC